jgi:hypothetical protein
MATTIVMVIIIPSKDYDFEPLDQMEGDGHVISVKMRKENINSV